MSDFYLFKYEINKFDFLFKMYYNYIIEKEKKGLIIMLKTIDLIKDVNEELVPMLKMVNIVDFTKCISIFSGLKLDLIDDNMIKDYLLTWAKNKYRIFKMLGNQIKKDIKFSYEKVDEDKEKDYKTLIHDYPEYGPWLSIFSSLPINKIILSYRYNTSRITEYFPNLGVEGMSITHFAKKYLKFPDEVVTKLGRIYENNKVDANYTISIDPVDIMTASENPYDWCSCYRLETDNTESHADGCMAAMLDENSTITYVWNSEGKLDLYKQYELKNVRYKRMRQWVSISENLGNISFCEIYPGRDYPDNFYKQLREIYEDVVASYHKTKNYWKNSQDGDCYREYSQYGYSEFHKRVLVLEGFEEQKIPVYTEPIKCACGCGTELIGSYDCDDGDCYIGEGFNCNGWNQRYWCEYCEDYCDSDGEKCEGCSYWDDAHPVCELDESEECEYYDGIHYVRNGVASACSEHCENCPHWEEHQKEMEEEEEEEEDKENILVLESPSISTQYVTTETTVQNAFTRMSTIDWEAYSNN